MDLWLKDVAPSPELRKWFGHDPARWEQFQERYRQELRQKKDAVQLLKQKGKETTLTLVYAARDEDHNGARLCGPTTNTLTIKDGKRQTIADAYLTPALPRPNLTLLPWTEVQSLIVKRGRCTGFSVTHCRRSRWPHSSLRWATVSARVAVSRPLRSSRPWSRASCPPRWGSGTRTRSCLKAGSQRGA